MRRHRSSGFGLRHRRTLPHERGIALIQVLLITGILSLLVVQLSLTAQEQVRRAQALADRAETDLALQSHESTLLYALLTEPWIPADPAAANPYTAHWNFRGQPFEADGVQLAIQDENGRMTVPLYGTGELERLLVVLGVEAERARRLGRELMAHQGVRAMSIAQPGVDPYAIAFPLQRMEELRRLPEMDEALYRRLEPLLTLYPTPGFNPLTASPELLKTRLSDTQLAGVLELRAAGQLDESSLWRLTGIEADDFTVLQPGPALTVDLAVGRGGVLARRVSTFVVRPYVDEAVAVWSRR